MGKDAGSSAPGSVSYVPHPERWPAEQGNGGAAKGGRGKGWNAGHLSPGAKERIRRVVYRVEKPESKSMGIRKGTVSQKQREVISALQRSGNAVAVCYGAEEAIKTIKGYLNDEISNCGDNCGA